MRVIRSLMRVTFESDQVRRLAVEPGFTGAFAASVVTRDRERLQFIATARDERDFFAWRSLRFERLKGNRHHQYSMRLNAQWRLIMEINDDSEGKRVNIIEIVDYH